MEKVFLYAWRVLRYFKPVRTFWMTLAALLPVMAVGIEGGSVALDGVAWLTALSGAATAAIFNFVLLMSTGDSMWSEPKENNTVVNAKPVKNTAKEDDE